MSYVAYSTELYREDGQGGEVYVSKKILRFPIGAFVSQANNQQTLEIARSMTGFGFGYSYAGNFNLPNRVSSFCGWSNFIFGPGVVFGEDYYRFYFDKEHTTYIRVHRTSASSGTRQTIFADFVKNNATLVQNIQIESRFSNVTGNRYQASCDTLPAFDVNTHKLYNIRETAVLIYTTSEIRYWSTDSASVFLNEIGDGDVWFIPFFQDIQPVDEDNPYFDGGTSEEGGGNGNFSEDSDNPETDQLPTIDAIGTGFATIFKPDKAQLRNLSELFWNSNVFTFLQNLVENITDMFTSLAMVPFDVMAGSTVSVTWLGIDTAVSLTLAAKQYYEFDMGSIDLANDGRIFTSGSALDYSPFSTLGIYLPFIGYQELDIDECRDAVINLRYRIDILSGACVAIIKVAGRDIYQFTGNCLTQIPITNENMQSLVTDAVNVGIAASGAQAAKGTMSAVQEQIESSNMSAERAEVAMAHARTNLGHSESKLASATANVMTSGKPSFKKSGAVSSAASMMSVKQPYLFLTTPRQSIPEHYQRYCGFPSNITGKLGDFSGYTVVENIRLNDLVATSPEVAEIYDLLKKGVII